MTNQLTLFSPLSKKQLIGSNPIQVGIVGQFAVKQIVGTTLKLAKHTILEFNKI
jgi:hypothetical protein